MAAASALLSQVVAGAPSSPSASLTSSSSHRNLNFQQFHLPLTSQHQAHHASCSSSLRSRGPSLAPAKTQTLQLRFRERRPVSGRPFVVRSGVPEVTEADFEKEVLQADSPVLVDFWAPWCGPCKLVVPVIEGIAKDYGGKIKVVKVEADPNPTLVKKYKVYGLPMLVMFQNGEVVFQNEGAITKAKVKAMIGEKLPTVVAN